MDGNFKKKVVLILLLSMLLITIIGCSNSKCDINSEKASIKLTGANSLYTAKGSATTICDEIKVDINEIIYSGENLLVKKVLIGLYINNNDKEILLNVIDSNDYKTSYIGQDNEAYSIFGVKDFLKSKIISYDTTTSILHEDDLNKLYLKIETTTKDDDIDVSYINFTTG